MSESDAETGRQIRRSKSEERNIKKRARIEIQTCASRRVHRDGTTEIDTQIRKRHRK